MEVHPPQSPIHSVKDFMMHLLAITIGLLIALGLESSVEWVHHRRLVREARENISQEIGYNQRNVTKELGQLPTEEGQLEKLMAVLEEREKGTAANPDKNMVWSVTRLSDASWNTAFSTGAVAHMDYDDVRHYAQLYALQQLYNSSMDRYLESRRDMYVFLAEMNLPDKPSQAEFEVGKRAIASEMVTAEFLREISASLSENYKQFQGRE